MTSIEPEPELLANFKTWFSSRGGYIHKDVQFKQGEAPAADSLPTSNIQLNFQIVSSGLKVLARDTVPADTCIASCPFSLAITPEVSKKALLTLLKSPDGLDKWTERQLICTYLSLHWVLGDFDLR